jgi:nifR3 family TIM-barrel protein
MQIATLLQNNPYVLAPLAGYTDLPFRLLCRELGAGLCFSEMISCHGLVYGQRNTLILMKSTAEDRPLGIQLFGGSAEVMAEAAAQIDVNQADFIDINMGCPVRKVIKKGAGAALMKDMDLASSIISQVVANTSLPVTVKFRSGWNNEAITAPEFARMAESAGASAVTIHARTWAQAFGGLADRKVIAQVKQAVSIPVIGNGDVLSFADGKQMMLETGCDGVMIGRGALGNPWVFSEAGRPDTLQGRLPVIQRHIELITRHMDAEKMLFRIKNHTGRYLSELPGASRIRKKIMECKDVQSLMELITQSDYQ